MTRVGPRVWLWAVGVVALAAGCGGGRVDVEAAPVPEFLASAEDGERFRLSEAFGSDWAYAIADVCPGDDLEIEGMTVSTEYFECVDPEAVPASVALVDADGRLVRFYPELEGAWSVLGCYTPEAMWVRWGTSLEWVGEGRVRCPGRLD